MTPVGRCQIPSDFAPVGISFTFTEPVLLFITLPCVFIVLECEQVRLVSLNFFYISVFILSKTIQYLFALVIFRPNLYTFSVFHNSH